MVRHIVLADEQSRRLRQFCLALVLLLCATPALWTQAATGEIRGKVQDNQERPLKGVEVTMAETGAKTVSDQSGEFALSAPAAGHQARVLFRAPGYYPQTVTVDLGRPAQLVVSLSPVAVVREDVRVIAPRLGVPLSEFPAAASVVAPSVSVMPRSVAADEALASVSGMKIDNQANGERVHVSIRGQGILTESGIRGIEVLLDGIPLNDPSGFVPDLFDVDWAGVQEVSVVKGPVGFLYGGGSSGGVIDVQTRASAGDFRGGVLTEGGSNGFYKGRVEFSGTAANVGYYVAAARAAGDGYREHTAFYGDNLRALFSFRPKQRLQLNTVLMGTGYFNQNPEGLNLAQVQQDPRQPNPDALTFNEYQRTRRFTGGVTGALTISDHQQLAFTYYTRHTDYKEPVPSSVDHRSLTAPGGSLQYSLDGGRGRLKHHLSAGVDLDGQFMGEFRRPNLGNAVEDNALLSAQDITQGRIAGYITERVGLGPRWTAMLGARIDRVSNRLTDNLRVNGEDLSGQAIFRRATARVGISYNANQHATLYATWGQGFLPPSTEELDANPLALSGFNRSLRPATSQGPEFGVRGNLRDHLIYDVEFFHLSTSNDFERYRITSRALETFYGNAGNSSRNGLETELRWLPAPRVTLSGAYTYSHFIYTKYDSLTYPGNLVGNWLPNSPAHQVFADASFELPRHFLVGASTTAYSRAYIDPTNTTWIDGYGLLNARISKGFQFRHGSGTLFVSGRNLTAKSCVAFTEPDPDGNSYQPGPKREVFAGLQIGF